MLYVTHFYLTSTAGSPTLEFPYKVSEDSCICDPSNQTEAILQLHIPFLHWRTKNKANLCLYAYAQDYF